MPIHLLWGNDSAATERAIEQLITKVIDPAWSSVNLSRTDGSDNEQAKKALEEIRTPPFGNGGRLVLIKCSPFCNGCSNELAKCFEDVLGLIPSTNHLIINNTNKPDARLRTTKALKAQIKEKQAYENSFMLPAIWDSLGQKELIKRTAEELGLEVSSEATSLLVETIGNDSARLTSELQKLALFADINKAPVDAIQKKTSISTEAVKALIDGLATNALQVGESLLANNLGEAITRLNAMLDQGEPALRILATLAGQVRGWLWVSLLDEAGEKDVAVIAKAAGIANPKRIYVMRKQIKGIEPSRFLNLLESLLEIEAGLKKGVLPADAFKDGLLKRQIL